MDANSVNASAQAPVAAEEEIIFLEPGQEKAQNIVKAISHQNAGDIMALLSAEGPMKLSDIASRMELSTNAAKYHVENLKNAGLIEIANTRYSVKGKKMKVYRLKNQVFIVAPGVSSGPALRAVLLKYATLCGLFVVSFAIFLVQPFVTFSSGPVSPISGSLQTGSALPAMYSSELIPALVLALIVTLLVFAGVEVLGHWRDRNGNIS
ncbi:winged helix-turn-helix domain-containing protein [Methanoregula sp.]|uniref:ArsR/SmtB family transcription factor n=1 Tax=Methanoregula sp. TaxID=2052170 RepID=UPI002CCBD7BB|nr:winged helix-turn-helix domain-containing protein [Methanoregula sp.]HVP97578.1 winged helix-turn-helix domain-containing protein [Methanoregula sp.]